MQKTRFFSKTTIAILVLSFWFVSTISLWIAQSKELLEPGNAKTKILYPEIPGAEPDAALAIMAACHNKVEPNDILGVVFNGGEAAQLFLAYRLAYELYPRRVASLGYSGNGLADAIDQLEKDCHPTLLLVFGGTEYPHPMGSRIVARLPFDSFLLRLAAERNPQ